MSQTLLGKLLFFCTKNKNLLFSFEDILKDSNLKNESEKEIIKIIETSKCFFIAKDVDKNKNFKISIDFDLMICDYYNEQEGCGPRCYKLHICKNVIKSKPCDKTICKLEHDINSNFNADLFKKNGINPDIKEILDFYRVIYIYFTTILSDLPYF
jgi:hypothetical protein